jgi:DEAD/DEAH box helicase domain-containing protein
MTHIKDALGFRVGLNAIAKETINHQKVDHGLNAVKYWAEHTPESLLKLKTYCEADVMVTKEVYDYGLKQGHLKFMDKWNTIRQFSVNFSYPKVDTSIPVQTSLF